MNRKKKYKIIAIAGVVFLLLLAGILLFRNINAKQTSSEKAIIKENVAVITQETEKEKQPIEVLDDSLIFSTEPSCSAGDVMVSGIIDSAPEGFIRKVVGIRKDGERYVVDTEYALLTDVFEELHLTRSFMLTENGADETTGEGSVQSEIREIVKVASNTNVIPSGMVTKNDGKLSIIDADSDYLFGIDYEEEICDTISLEGELGFSIWLDVNIEIKRGDIYFELVAHDKQGGSIFLGCSQGKEMEFSKEILEINLPSFQFMAGTIPIVVTNDLEATLEVSGEIAGEVGVTVGIDTENAQGFSYNSKNNKVKEINEKEYLSDGLTWDTEVKFSGEFSAGIYLHLLTRLYGSTGTDISLGIAAEVEGMAGVSPKQYENGENFIGSLDMSIGPKLQGSIVVSVPVIDTYLASRPIFEKELPAIWEKHWELGENWEEELSSVIVIDKTSEWYAGYSKAIDEIRYLMERGGGIYITSPHYVREPKTSEERTEIGGEVGGSLDGLTELYYYLHHLDEDESVPELFLGNKEDESIIIVACYSFVTSPSYSYAYCIEGLWDSSLTRIELCSDNTLLIESKYGNYRMSMPWDYFKNRKEVDYNLIIDSNELDWRSIDEW